MAGTGMTAGPAVAGVVAGDVAGDVVEGRSGGVTGVVWRDEFLRVRAILAFVFPFCLSVISSICLRIPHLYRTTITHFLCLPTHPSP